MPSTYSREAISQLKQVKVVGFYKELEASALTRKGWSEAWLAQPLDIRPSEEGRQAIAQIAQRARRVKRPAAKSAAAT